MAEHDTSLVDGVTWMRFEPEQYDAELERKVAATRAQFAHLLDGAEVKIHASSPTHYRQRVRLALSRCAPNDRLSYMLWDHKGPWLRLEQPRFPVASEAINALMPPLLEALNASDVLGAGVAQVHFLSTQVGDMLVTLHYRHELHPGWREAGRALRAAPRLPRPAASYWPPRSPAAAPSAASRSLSRATARTSRMRTATRPRAPAC